MRFQYGSRWARMFEMALMFVMAALMGSCGAQDEEGDWSPEGSLDATGELSSGGESAGDFGAATLADGAATGGALRIQAKADGAAQTSPESDGGLEATVPPGGTQAPMCGGVLRIRCPWGMVCVLAGGDKCNRLSGNDCLGICVEVPGGR